MKNTDGIRIINASAGSGKTYRLTGEIASTISDGLTPESIMAVTFTNLAAGDLTEKTRQTLLGKGLYDEAVRVTGGFIGTVNSVCTSLLSEYALFAGLSPALAVMSEEDGQSVFETSSAEAMAEYARDVEPPAWRLGVDGGGIGFQKRHDWKEDIKRVTDAARYNLISPEALREHAEKSWLRLSEFLNLVEPVSRDGSALERNLDVEVESAISMIETIEKPPKITLGGLEKLKEFRELRRKQLSGGREVKWSKWVGLTKLDVGKIYANYVESVRLAARMFIAHPLFRGDVKMLVNGVFNCASEALKMYDSFKKRHGIMDFADQEIKILELASRDEAFRASMESRIRAMMIDEFQDTNPIQLSLFLVLHQLAGTSVWVGDPKQAIYGFRGSDPGLMDSLTRGIKNTSTLRYSWRSKQLLVDFCNTVFTEVFKDMPGDNVRLEIPEERKLSASGGDIELWRLLTKNNEGNAFAIAKGVASLIYTGTTPADIAVLCRKNDECELVASYLRELGIKASTPQGTLMETAECSLASAALRYLYDKRDTLALAEIVRISPRHRCRHKWLELMISSKDWIDRFKDDPIVLALDTARLNLQNRTPLEALNTAISCISLPETVKSWPDARTRRNNMDALCGVCNEYMDICVTHRRPATVPGFINYLRAKNPKKPEGTGKNTVRVCTYHGAKGLEWPIVVLTSLNSTVRGGYSGVYTDPAPSFDPARPLEGRSIRYWPDLPNFPELKATITASPEYQSSYLSEFNENKRLMYVGMTRAQNKLIFAARLKINSKNEEKLEIGWLDSLGSGAGQLITWPEDEGEGTVSVSGESGRRDFRMHVINFACEEDKDQHPRDSHFTNPAVEFVVPSAGKRDFPRAFISPSQMTRERNASVEVIADFDARIRISGRPDMDSLGNAIHSFFAADQADITHGDRLAIASRLLRAWDVHDSVEPTAILSAYDRLESFIATRFDVKRILRELPISLRNEDNSNLRGFIDILVETSDCFAIIDHKSYPGTDLSQIGKFAAQLAEYKRAVEIISGRSVAETLIHLPFAGQIIKIHFP